ncbi:MAG TPA: hypothetical protein DCZ72_04240, partial [Armatimonadetes bacterium]|nr:hypothetical protein [Armatimonadota bacterium]
ASCSSNLKQIGLAIKQYEQDYDEMGVNTSTQNMNPTANDLDVAPPTNAVYITWDEAIQPYMKSVQLLNCPSDSRRSGAGGKIARSYTSNCRVMGNGPDAVGWWPGAPTFALSIAAVTSPASTIQITERWDNSGDRVVGNANFHAMKYYAPNDLHRFQDVKHPERHMANFLFNDGHVKLMRATATINPIDLWNPNQ